MKFSKRLVTASVVSMAVPMGRVSSTVKYNRSEGAKNILGTYFRPKMALAKSSMTKIKVLILNLSKTVKNFR